jgi:hypothetical protein
MFSFQYVSQRTASALQEAHAAYDIYEEGVLWNVSRVALRTDISEKFIASFIRVTRIGELGTTRVVLSCHTEEGRAMFF